MTNYRTELHFGRVYPTASKKGRIYVGLFICDRLPQANLILDSAFPGILIYYAKRRLIYSLLIIYDRGRWHNKREANQKPER